MQPPVPAQVRLDDEALAGFGRDGFLVLRNFFGPAQMEQISVWTDELVARPERPGKHMVYYEDSLHPEGGRVVQRIEDFCRHHRGFDALLNAGAVLELMGDLFGEPAVLFKDKINFKMPGGDGFKAHQDVQAGWDRYASLHITLLLSIDPATTENGCLELVPGAHRTGLLGEMWKPLDDAAGGLVYRAYPTRPGDVVVFDSYVPHRSARNLTDKPRRVLYVTYNRASEGDHRAQYYADKRASYPPDIERDPAKRYVFRV